jgi:hypothetical protein
MSLKAPGIVIPNHIAAKPLNEQKYWTKDNFGKCVTSNSSLNDFISSNNFEISIPSL